MTRLSEEDVDAIADRLIERVRAQRHDFWIDPETHYKQHIALNGMLEDYKHARTWFWTVFITLVAGGAAVLAGLKFFKGGGA